MYLVVEWVFCLFFSTRLHDAMEFVMISLTGAGMWAASWSEVMFAIMSSMGYAESVHMSFSLVM